MLFDVLICFLRRSLHCLPRPHLFSKLNHAGDNNNAAVRSLAASHIVLLPLSLSLSLSLSTAEVYLGSQFSFGHIKRSSFLPWNPKGNESPIRKEEDASRSSFRSVETWHDKRRGENTAPWSLSLPPQRFRPQLPALCSAPTHESFPLIVGLNTHSSKRRAPPFLCCAVSGLPHHLLLHGEKPESLNMADVLNYLQAPLTSCIVVCAAAALWAGQTAAGRGGEQTTVKRRSECWGCGAMAGDDWALRAAWRVQAFLMAHRPAPRETSSGEKRKRRLYFIRKDGHEVDKTSNNCSAKHTHHHILFCK